MGGRKAWKNCSADDFPERLNISQNRHLITRAGEHIYNLSHNRADATESTHKPSRPRKYPTFRVNKKPKRADVCHYISVDWIQTSFHCRTPGGTAEHRVGNKMRTTRSCFCMSALTFIYLHDNLFCADDRSPNILSIYYKQIV